MMSITCTEEVDMVTKLIEQQPQETALTGLDSLVMARLRKPFGYELIPNALDPLSARYRIFDANDDAIASVSSREEGYAKLIVQALNEHFERRK